MIASSKSRILAASAWALIVACAGALCPAPARAQTSLPTDFADSLVVAGLDLPTGFDFVPGSRAATWRLLFVEQKTARIRMITNGVLGPADPVLTVPNVRTSGGEQGLLGIALDPQFPWRPYLYVHADDDRSAHIRISRFTVSGDLFFTSTGALFADPASRYDLVADIPDNADNHNGGTVRFGPDGMLYVSLGEDANECGAQDSVSLRGVILRLRTTTLPAGPGSATRAQVTPPDNPFVARPDANLRLVWALGLRNPFRFQIDPPTGRLVIADVGYATWEELDIAATGGLNFGWPFREGFASYASCATPASGFTAPILVMGHNEAFSIMSAGIYRPVLGSPRSWPAADYDGDVFYSDYYGGMLRRRHFDGSSWVSESAHGQPNATDWGTGFDAVTDYRVGPDGGLWYCRQAGSPGDFSGEIRRIVWVGAFDADAPGPRASAVALAAHPVPMRASLTLRLRLPDERRVALGVYDVRGRRVRALVEPSVLAAGEHVVSWDGRDEDGRAASPGLYWARLEAGDERRSLRVPMLR